MLGVGWPELMVVAVVTVLVVGPKELPRVLRAFTMFVRKAQKMAQEFQSGMEDLARQADLDDIKKVSSDVQKDIESSSFKVTDQMDEMLDPQNTVAGMFTGTAISTLPEPPAVTAADAAVLPADAKVAGATEALPPPAAAPSNVIPAPAPVAKKELAAVPAAAAEPVPLEKRRAGA